ncbi:VOC family protein [Roseibium suaedae]|uniref:Glyoxalase superfamily enzyme, possibly 3-demethylubiquinone-9 3-methyltransferase n=1 Tax=Roseibium suaedae TaxID=735517 RepID=A0A1M7BZ14_9HYPH|nr:VOC family protein [Roseibium suaedae]SHL60298.1 Glyoxalase superfamily enzyme, possibly 3-demethylubiquinone-9 3-methyltransferase [Roseibium suaedae]
MTHSDVTYRETPLGLELERIIPAPRQAVWRCWVEPELLMQWFCPKPWRVSRADMKLRPGGRFNVVMEGPEGERMECPGIYLEVIPGEALTFTDAYQEDFVPQPTSFMTGYVRLEDTGEGATRFIWGARHSREEDKQRHLEMGFKDGWKAASDQLETLSQEIAAQSRAPDFKVPEFKAKVRTSLFLEKDALLAAEFYVSLLPDSRIDAVYRPDPAGPELVVEFTLAGTPYMTMNGNPQAQPSFLSSISVLTEDQPETDRLWQKLSEKGGQPGNCGWIQDRFGIHWQIVPKALPRLMSQGGPGQAARVQSALMSMTRIDISGLEAAAQAA